MIPDYYAILEIIFPSNQEDIKKNYKRVAKKWHPDVSNLENATQKMQEITEAYYFLCDEQQKKLYDKKYRELFGSKIDENPFQSEEKKYDSNNDLEWDKLNDWIQKTRERAQKTKLDILDETKGASLNGCKIAGKFFLFGLAFIVLIILIGVLARLFN